MNNKLLSSYIARNISRITAIFVGLAMIVIALATAPSAEAAYTADDSAQLTLRAKLQNEYTVPQAKVSEKADVEQFLKVQAIRNVLSKYNSPMVDQADTFVAVAETMNLDTYMLPSMAGVESAFGTRLIQGTYNPFGWNVGRTYFANWDEGIATVGEALRFNYYDKGAEDIHAVGRKYAGGSNTWGPKVISFMEKFEKEEETLRRYYML